MSLLGPKPRVPLTHCVTVSKLISLCLKVHIFLKQERGIETNPSYRVAPGIQMGWHMSSLHRVWYTENTLSVLASTIILRVFPPPPGSRIRTYWDSAVNLMLHGEHEVVFCPIFLVSVLLAQGRGPGDGHGSEQPICTIQPHPTPSPAFIEDLGPCVSAGWAIG